MKKEIVILCVALFLLAGCSSSKTDDVTNTEAQKEIPAGVVVEDAAPGDVNNTETQPTDTTMNGEAPIGDTTTDTDNATVPAGEGSGTDEINDGTSLPIDENAVPGQMKTETEEVPASTDETPVRN